MTLELNETFFYFTLFAVLVIGIILGRISMAIQIAMFKKQVKILKHTKKRKSKR